MLRWILILSLLLTLHVTLRAAAQNPTLRAPHKVLPARKINARIKVDGKLDEPVWETIPAITEFVQTDPEQGAPASERSEARIFYDAQNIYFGFRFYDSHPELIVHRLGAHDGRTNSDSVDILIDTFHDRRTGYYFSVNCRGIQFDGISQEGNGKNGFDTVDATWDGIWYSAASVESWGWQAEVAIPLKSIRLARASQQEWGLNFGRDLVRKNERAYWVEVARFDGVMKPSKAGVLTGIENVDVGRNLELIPFITTKYRGGSSFSPLDGPKGTGGLDARYGVSANLTANLAINPDFGETEADEFTAQISRFEIFFPEKRKFFTEGANYFQTPMSLFFSRRIGARLPNGEPQRILEGGKLTGKAGAWSVGGLEALTQRTEFTDPATGLRQVAPGAFFGVLRLQRDILQKSAIGFISVNRLQSSGSLGQHESSHGVDLQLLHGPHITWASQMMVNTSSSFPGVDLQHLGWSSDFIYDSEEFTYEAKGKFLGRRVDLSNTGFEPETNRWSGQMRTVYKPFINRWGMRQIFTELNYDESNDTEGGLQDAGGDVRLSAQLKNFWNLKFSYSYDRVRFNYFTPQFTRLVPARVYHTPIYRAIFSTNENRKFVVSGEYDWGKFVEFEENFYGIFHNLQLTLSARVSDHLRWELTSIRERQSLLDKTSFQDRQFLISRWNYQFTPKLRSRILAQYANDRHGRDLSVNSLVAYDFTARSALFIGYNHQRHSAFDPTDLGNEAFVKFSYLFSF